MNTRFMSPPRNELQHLRTPLRKGELTVLDFFDSYLSQEWEIYVQPYLNGLRPDFVLLNPSVGIAVYEVKDWNLSALQYHTRTREGKTPELIASDMSGTEFSLQSENPVERVYRYKHEIYELYCPRLKQKAGLSAITAGVIFPFAKKEEVFYLLKPCYDFHKMNVTPQYHPIAGSDDISSCQITRVFPEAERRHSQQMNETLAKDLRNWLIEPDFAATQREPLELDANQRRYTSTRTQTGYRRLKGPAGSGKSVVLAARASQLVAEGKTVLVITYNITLLHYLMDVAVRWPHGNGNTRRDITWLNFHSWCKRVCEESDYYEEYRSLWRGCFETEQDLFDAEMGGNAKATELLTDGIPTLVKGIVDRDNGRYVTKYDAILVDEGQDMLPAWWNALRKVCKPGGEMFLVADATQDIYDTARSWTDEAMVGAGFSGEWATLSVSYRLPPQVIDATRYFAKQFLPSDNIDLPQNPQGELSLYPCNMRWIQTTQEKAVAVSAEAIMEMAPLADPDILAIPDITFLSPSQNIGLQVTEVLDAHNIKAVHTYSRDTRELRRLKLGFFMGDARVKATTLHSFKGWETRGLVVYTGHRLTPKTMALIYTGLTRIKRHTKSSYITVVSALPELAAYGKTWGHFEER